MAGTARRRAVVLCAALLAACVGSSWAVSRGPAGQREHFQSLLRQHLGSSRQEDAPRRARTLLTDDFDPKVSSLSYCEPKTYPSGDKKLKPVRGGWITLTNFRAVGEAMATALTDGGPDAATPRAQIKFDTPVTDLRWAHEVPYEDKVRPGWHRAVLSLHRVGKRESACGVARPLDLLCT